MNYDDETLSNREKGMIRMRSIMDLGMGILWLCMGVFMLFVRLISPSMALRYDDPVMKGFGLLCMVYGAFRIYRGIKKNYRK